MLGLTTLHTLCQPYLFFSGKQGHTTDLAQVHAHWIIQNVQFGVGLFVFLFLFAFFLSILITVHLGCFDHVDFHAAELAKNGVKFIGVCHSFGKRLVEVVEGDVALFLGQLGQFANSALQIIRCNTAGPQF